MKTRYFSLTSLALAMSFLTMPLIAAEKPVEGPIDPFRGEAKFELQQLFTGARMPNVVVATDGTVLATWGATGRWDKGVRVRRSKDGGKTWGDPITIANPGWQGGGLTVDETTGDILAFVEQWEWPKPPLSMTVYRSTDHGKTWKAQETVVHKDSNGNVPGMHMAEHGITLRHGKHKGRLLRPAREWAGGDRKPNWPKMYNTAIYSDDGGKTWRTSDPFPAMGTGEGAVAELSDGRIYYNSRRHSDPKGVDSSMRWEAWSDDGGETWKDLAVSKVLPDGPQGKGLNGCMGGLMRLPVRGRDIILYSNCDSANRERKDVTVWASFDGTKTWPIKRRVFEGPSAYSSLSAGRPGTPSEGWTYILLEGGKKHRYEGAYLARFNLSWLLEGKKTGDGELPRWLGAAAKAPAGQSNSDGFVWLFDGKTLAGWHAVPKASASDWTVRDGAIVGRGSADRLSYLVWKDEHLTDFELKLSYRLPSKGNTGVEIRCQPDRTGKRPFEGYHADLGHVGIGPHILGAWDFHFAKRKEYPCRRGTRLVIDADGKAHPSTIRGALTLADIRRRQWNDVRIIARGRHFKFFINGKLASEFTDNAKQGRLDHGAIGLQIHDKGMHVEFKDIRLKRLVSRTQPEKQVTVGQSQPPLPTIDISGETNRHSVVAPGTKSVYQGHPHTLLLADGKTIYCVWTLIHGHGAPRMKRSDDGGKTWSKLLALPEGWAPYGHCPTLHRIIATDKKEHLLLMDRTGRTINFAQAISRDNGKTWTPMKPNGLKGIVAPISIVSVDGGKKHLMWTHRGAGDRDKSPLTVWQAESTDAGLTWKNYHEVCEVPGKDPCEPAVVRSPDDKQLLMLIRDNKHKGNSLRMVSDDEGKTWSKPVETSWGLTGDRHCPKYAPDGRLVVVFRDVAQPCPPRGHFVAWVGRYEDIVKGREGQYRIKLMHHHGRAGDTGYAGLELLPDGTFAATTYIKYKPGPEKHSVVSVRFKLDEIDKKLKARK